MQSQRVMQCDLSRRKFSHFHITFFYATTSPEISTDISGFKSFSTWPVAFYRTPDFVFLNLHKHHKGSVHWMESCNLCKHPSAYRLICQSMLHIPSTGYCRTPSMPLVVLNKRVHAAHDQYYLRKEIV